MLEHVRNRAVTPRLRDQRRRLGFTQADLAERVASIAWQTSRERVGVNADMVAKWERGAKGISRRYQLLLAAALHVTPGDLGFGPEPSKAPAGQDHSMGDAADLVERLGPAGVILQPRLMAAWKDESMRRRSMLKLMGLTPTAGLVPSLPAADDATGQLDELADRYQAVYHSTSPAVLLAPVVAHLDTVTDVIRGGATGPVRRRLMANQARVATLAGRISFFDLSDPMRARGFYNLALEAAKEAGDDRLAAAALGHVAFIPGSDLNVSAAADYLAAAKSHLDRAPHGEMLSWLGAVSSEIQAKAGDITGALRSIDQARESIDAGVPSPQVAWFDYYDRTRLDGFAGYANLRSGRIGDAEIALESAVASLTVDAGKQRAVYLADLAAVSLNAGDIDLACDRAGQAVDELRRSGYATGSGRIRELRAEMTPWADSRAVRLLDEQLAAA